MVALFSSQKISLKYLLLFRVKKKTSVKNSCDDVAIFLQAIKKNTTLMSRYVSNSCLCIFAVLF